MPEICLLTAILSFPRFDYTQPYTDEIGTGQGEDLSKKLISLKARKEFDEKMADMINYNIQSMSTVAKTIQSNGHELNGDLQNLWSLYQADMYGAFPEFASHLTAFMDLCKSPSLSLAQNRIDIGTKLGQAATAAESTDETLQKGFQGLHMVP